MTDLEEREQGTVHVEQPDVIADVELSAELIADLSAQSRDQVSQVQGVTESDVAQLDLTTRPDRVAKPAAFRRWEDSMLKRQRALELAAAGSTISGIQEDIEIADTTWYGWRKKYPEWWAQVTAARQVAQMRRDEVLTSSEVMAPAAFSAHYFGMMPAWFQLYFMQEVETMPRGNILLVLWPPGSGKTTTFENWANRQLALHAGWRFLVASESRDISSKILGRVMDRMNPLGPTPGYVKDFGPFMPDSANGGVRQPWTEQRFRVYRARTSDQRNYSMEAVGARGSVVSARTDHAHVDDIQSTKTLNLSDKIATWFRQDLLSRPGEEGITSVCGTRVDDGDFYETLLEDPDLGDIMKVIRLPAVITDKTTGEQKPLWEGVHTLESLDRIRRKVGAEVWDRNWMQNPGASRSGKGTFTRDAVDRCKDVAYSVENRPGHEGDHEPVMIIGVDPALGSKNVVTASEATPDGKLIPRRIREDVGFERNEQIMGAIEDVVRWCITYGIVVDVVIEEKNFQLGLKNDDRMRDMADHYGFALSGHMTGWSKYDPDIGVASMAASFIKREIVIPWADDEQTRHMMGEFCRQLFAWKPGVKGNRLRQDQVMAFWFTWMRWRAMRRDISAASTRNTSPAAFTRQTGGFKMNGKGIYTPMGVS